MTPTLNDLADGIDRGAIINIDVDVLVQTRALIQANSGAGKSYTIRRILEQTYGAVQHIVIDVEGEFHTLRQSYDYVLAAPRGGDCVADCRTAELLARRLLELGASAIIDIYELGVQQRRFVRLFLESLMSAPRDLWHSVIVVVDEAHKFCAEKEDAESASAVIDLMTRGRKRGFCGILATQRLSKLDKDAAAEANNLLIGRTALDLDIARAATVLGMPIKDARATLPKLAAGEFFCVGPALSPTVERVRVGHVKTHHPKAGTRGAPPTPPRDKVRQLLAKLADLPAEAEDEVKTVAELRARVRELEAIQGTVSDIGSSREKLHKDYIVLDERAAALEKRVIETERERDEARSMERVLEANNEALVKEIDASIDKLHIVAFSIDGMCTSLTVARNDSLTKYEEEVEERDRLREVNPRPHKALWDTIKREHGNSWPGGDHVFVDPQSAPLVVTDPVRAWAKNDYSNMPAMERAMLTVLAQRSHKGPGGSETPITKDKLLVWSGYSRGGATSKAFAALVKAGWAITSGAGAMVITNAGLKALGAYEEMPTGAKLRERIKTGLPGAMERAFFAIVVGAYPRALSKQEILESTGYSRGGATSKAFAYLTARDYVIADGPGKLRAAKELFE